MILWLVGMPGSGKTTLSGMLGVPHVDTDDLILQTTQTDDLASVVDSNTDEAFYELEGRVVKELAESLGDVQHMVIATGGSVVHSSVAVDAMRSAPNSTVVWLQASMQDVLARCGGVEGMRARGVVMEDGGMEALWQRRNPLYAAVSHHQLDTSTLHISECCEYLSRLLK